MALAVIAAIMIYDTTLKEILILGGNNFQITIITGEEFSFPWLV